MGLLSLEEMLAEVEPEDVLEVDERSHRASGCSAVSRERLGTVPTLLCS